MEGFASVTVIAEKALIAGTASTVAMLKGEIEGKAWLENLGLEHICITHQHKNLPLQNTKAES